MTATEAELGPPRLLEGGGSDQEQRLLESAVLDVMPDAVGARLAEALCVPPLPAGSSPVAGALPAAGSASAGSIESVSSAGSLGAKGLGRLGRLGALGSVGGLGALAVAGAWWFASTDPAPARGRPEVPLAVTSDAQIESEATETATATGGSVEPARKAPEDAVVASRATLSPRAPSRTLERRVTRQASNPERAGIPVDRGSGLIEEVRLLEQARGALRSGSPDAAEQALAEHRARFARGELALEAELLQVDLLLARGEREAALARARALVARPGAGRYRERLQALLERATSQQTASGRPASGAERARASGAASGR